MRYLNTRITFVFEYVDYLGLNRTGFVTFRNRRVVDSAILYCEYRFRKFLECTAINPHFVRVEIILDNISNDLPASGNWVLEDGAVLFGEYRLLKSCNVMLNGLNRSYFKNQSKFFK